MQRRTKEKTLLKKTPWCDKSEQTPHSVKTIHGLHRSISLRCFLHYSFTVCLTVAKLVLRSGAAFIVIPPTSCHSSRSCLLCLFCLFLGSSQGWTSRLFSPHSYEVAPRSDSEESGSEFEEEVGGFLSQLLTSWKQSDFGVYLSLDSQNKLYFRFMWVQQGAVAVCTCSVFICSICS